MEQNCLFYLLLLVELFYKVKSKYYITMLFFWTVVVDRRVFVRIAHKKCYDIYYRVSIKIIFYTRHTKMNSEFMIHEII